MITLSLVMLGVGIFVGIAISLKDNKQVTEHLKVFTKEEIEYIKILINSDRVLNSHKHSSKGLYSEFDFDLFEFSGKIIDKLNKLKKDDK
ncbi:hypothetical protein AAXE64_08270 [Priestia megaterium]